MRITKGTYSTRTLLALSIAACLVGCGDNESDASDEQGVFMTADLLMTGMKLAYKKSML